jgi:chemotaxis protein CheD
MVPEPPLPELYLQPGESYLVSEPTIIRTILGSCIGVAFQIPRLGVGALCHPMLPACPRLAGASLSLAASRRYVDFAIRDMAKQFEALGARREEVLVKVFGGADVLAVPQRHRRPTVGRLNRDTAERTLREEGFRIAAARVGGNVGFHIEFNTQTGEVLLRELR